MGKSSSDEGKKAAKAGLCACGICCALCIGIPLLIIIIVIIIIVVAVGSAADDISSICDDGACDYTSTSCSVVETSTCYYDSACKGARTCVNSSCTGSSGC